MKTIELREGYRLEQTDTGAKILDPEDNMIHEIYSSRFKTDPDKAYEEIKYIVEMQVNNDLGIKIQNKIAEEKAKEKRSKEFSIYKYTYGGNILELKNWIDDMVSKGYNTVHLDLEYGYYSDIDEINLRVKD